MTLVAGRGGGHPARHGVVHRVASHRDQDLHEVGRKGLGVDLSSPGLGLSATFEWQMGRRRVRAPEVVQRRPLPQKVSSVQAMGVLPLRNRGNLQPTLHLGCRRRRRLQTRRWLFLMRGRVKDPRSHRPQPGAGNLRRGRYLARSTKLCHSDLGSLVPAACLLVRRFSDRLVGRRLATASCHSHPDLSDLTVRLTAHLRDQDLLQIPIDEGLLQQVGWDLVSDWRRRFVLPRDKLC